MAQFIVRNVEETVKALLQQRAILHGRSMEEEIRDILRDAVKESTAPTLPLGTHFTQLFQGIGLESEIPEQRGYSPRPASFDE